MTYLVAFTEDMYFVPWLNPIICQFGKGHIQLLGLRLSQLPSEMRHQAARLFAEDYKTHLESIGLWLLYTLYTLW